MLRGQASFLRVALVALWALVIVDVVPPLASAEYVGRVAKGAEIEDLREMETSENIPILHTKSHINLPMMVPIKFDFRSVIIAGLECVGLKGVCLEAANRCLDRPRDVSRKDYLRPFRLPDHVPGIPMRFVTAISNCYLIFVGKGCWSLASVFQRGENGDTSHTFRLLKQFQVLDSNPWPLIQMQSILGRLDSSFGTVNHQPVVKNRNANLSQSANRHYYSSANECLVGYGGLLPSLPKLHARLARVLVMALGLTVSLISGFFFF
jgi:hypothetical protein